MMHDLGSIFLLFAGVGSVLVCLGLYSLALQAHVYRRILAWNVLGSGIFLIFGGISKRNAEAGLSDPLPQALVITGIVVSVSATALALSITRRIRTPQNASESERAR